MQYFIVPDWKNTLLLIFILNFAKSFNLVLSCMTLTLLRNIPATVQSSRSCTTTMGVVLKSNATWWKAKQNSVTFCRLYFCLTNIRQDIIH